MSEIHKLLEFLRKTPGATPEALQQYATEIGLKITLGFRVEKFNGDYTPGAVPVEIIEGGDGKPTITTHQEAACH